MPATGTGRTPHAEWGRGGDTAQAGLTGHAHAGRARRRGGRPRRQRALAFVAGIFFAADLTFFHHAIVYLGAGLATVMGNLQVIFVGFIGWLLLGERPANRLVTAVPVALTGVVLISGVIGRGAHGSGPWAGAPPRRPPPPSSMRRWPRRSSRRWAGSSWATSARSPAGRRSAGSSSSPSARRRPGGASSPPPRRARRPRPPPSPRSA